MNKIILLLVLAGVLILGGCASKEISPEEAFKIMKDNHCFWLKEGSRLTSYDAGKASNYSQNSWHISDTKGVAVYLERNIGGNSWKISGGGCVGVCSIYYEFPKGWTYNSSTGKYFCTGT